MTTQAPILFQNASQVLTLAGDRGPRSGRAMAELGIVEGGSVLVAGERILWAGPHHLRPETECQGARVVDCEGKVVMPAFVDPHTHLVWGGDRKDELEMRLGGADYEAIFAAGGGILSSVRQTRSRDEDSLYNESLTRISRMRRAGTTSFEIKSGYGLDLETELTQLRVARRLRDAGFRVRSTCLAAHAIPEDARGSETARQAFIEQMCQEVLPAVQASGLADYCDVFCDRGALTPEESRHVLTAARKLGFAIRVHANEFGHTGGALLAAEFKAASADHLLHLNDDERSALREAGVVATMLPGTSLVLGKPYADGRALVEAGVAIAIATDCNPGSCALECVTAVIGLACYGNRLSPAEAVCASTHNAAVALGLGQELGRIEAGLQADLLVLDTPDYRDLIYHAGSPFVGQVYSRGAIIE